MYSLPPHTVELVLQYISPLIDPLPPHLISTPLRQRHHFLQISHSSPIDYLCWPSPDNAKIINLLDCLLPLSDQASHPTRYTSDLESTYAHVQLSSNAEGLRMLFHWDDTHTWRYHDLRLMPFPSSSFSTPHESLAFASNSICGTSTLPHASLNRAFEADQIDSDNDDSYWDSYGTGGRELTSSSSSRNISKPDLVGEDAYWAQYASVQGSADSTVPSPLPINNRQPSVNFNRDESIFTFPPENDPMIDVPVDAILSRPRPGPPSPNTLVHLLDAISPRKDIHFHDYPDALQSPSSNSNPSPNQTAADSDLITPPLPDEYLNVAVVSPAGVNGVPLSECHLRPPYEMEDKALTESIKGLYYLWKSGRKGETGEKDRAVFLQIVQEAVAYE